ncbi:serine hydrolase domain-containing protein [Bradyrhizobium sp.]|uniref:serine hydrolase domain-containing protein n=1 Tax=Bradyrhizobium sp. TaxID=376 RepID=UPI001EBD8D15|nr:serine hydrolase domain-containing protein [Bradyrhizobium sp.]MBV9981237.1 beta-lactamase family protein [Bradyrhizobium sp.]
MRLSLLWLLCLWLALSVPVFSAVAEPAPTCAGHALSEAPLAADTECTTEAGVNLTVPTGWTVAARDHALRLDPPGGDSHMILINVDAADAASAVAAAWQNYRPTESRPLRLVLPQEARNGWDERHIYEYASAPNEKLVVFALAWRADRHWTVAIVEASRATREKYAAGFSLIQESLQPAGFQRETFAGRAAHPLDPERIGLIKDFVTEQMQRFSIPGVGLSLIDGGRIVFEGGFGVKTLGKPEPVDADTLFLAASDTKAMTTLLLAELVDEGKLRWNEPVTEAYPSFKLGDAETTRQVEIRHLVCACTGLPRQDLEWLFNFTHATPESSLALLGTMQPTSRFGEVFQYSNLMAAAAGYVAASVLQPEKEMGAAYDDAMRTRVFAPLGMSRTTFDFATALSGDHASPHGVNVDGNTVPENADNDASVVPVRPAGGMWTSAHDLAQYVAMELRQGLLPDGRRLVSTENLWERRRPQVLSGYRESYGMGLLVNTQRDIPIIHHGGSLPGYRSEMMFLPEHGVGLVVLTNSDTGGYLTGFLLRRLLEVLFDGKPEATERATAAAMQRAAQIAKARAQLVVPADPVQAGRLASRYVNPVLGELRVETKDGTTTFDFGAWRSVVGSRRNRDKTTSFVTIDPAANGWQFVVDERNGERALIVRDAQHEYSFVEAN